MKRAMLVAAVVLGWCLATSLDAQVTVERGEGGWGAMSQPAPAGAGAVRVEGRLGMYGQMIKVCNLTEDQQAKIKDIEQERDKAVAAFHTENAEKLKAAREALGEASKSQDKDAIQKASKDYQEASAPLAEIYKRAQAQVMDLLTPEQKATWQEYQVMNSIRGMFGRAKLTDDQWAKIKAAYADLAKDKDARTEDIVRKLSAEVKGMLTDEQKEAMKVNPWINVKPGQPLPGAAVPGANPAAAPGAPAAGGAVIIQPGGAVIVITEGKEGAEDRK
jgi:Spy/CpxP family protein refolding chaperone